MKIKNIVLLFLLVSSFGNANEKKVPTDSLLKQPTYQKLLLSKDRVRKEDLGTVFYIHDIVHTGARELEGKLKSKIEGSLKSFLGGTTLVESDERTGKLILVTRKENLGMIKSILEVLDVPEKMKLTSKLFKLQHTESKDIHSILDDVIKNQQRIKQQVQEGKNVQPTATKTNARPTSPPPGEKVAPTSNQVSAAGSANDGGDGLHEFNDFTNISSDERSNAILVYGTKVDIEEIGRMIESLDRTL